MAERKRSSFSPPAVGGSSLLVVFAVLCLTVFALLSLSTVRADTRLAESSRQAVIKYYYADNRANEVLAQLRMGREPQGVDVTCVSVDYADGSWQEIYTYAVPISEGRELQVEVSIRDVNDYTIRRWQAVNVRDWEIDDGLNVWDGGLF